MKGKFRIPKRFQLYGQTIEVVFDSTVDFRNDNRGEAQFRVNKIALAPHTDTHPRPFSQIEQTFFHELVHYVALRAGIDLNERDTDLVGSLLHQAFTTMEYE